jgi:hypothetical protein
MKYEMTRKCNIKNNDNEITLPDQHGSPSDSQL